ncbi:MAG: hypothetical protein M1115_08550 [Actinobacteria bacterium]|nr:hypothetical protein [Actinomycetota bacterium]
MSKASAARTVTAELAGDLASRESDVPFHKRIELRAPKQGEIISDELCGCSVRDAGKAFIGRYMLDNLGIHRKLL